MVGVLYRNKEESKGVIDAIRIDLTPRLGCLLWTHVSLFYSMGLIGDIVCRHRRLINRERHTKRNPTHTLCILNNSCEKPRGGRVFYYGDDSQWHGILKLGVQFSQRQVHWVDIHTYTLYIVVQCQKRWRRGHIFTVNMRLPWINENALQNRWNYLGLPQWTAYF